MFIKPPFLTKACLFLQCKECGLPFLRNTRDRHRYVPVFFFCFFLILARLIGCVLYPYPCTCTLNSERVPRWRELAMTNGTVTNKPPLRSLRQSGVLKCMLAESDPWLVWSASRRPSRKQTRLAHYTAHAPAAPWDKCDPTKAGVASNSNTLGPGVHEYMQKSPQL